MKVDLTNCNTVDQIEKAAFDAISGYPMVGGVPGARRYFDSIGVTGRVRAKTVFFEKKEVSQLWPHSSVTVHVVIKKYYVPGCSKCAYGYDLYIF